MSETRKGDWFQTYTGKQFWPLDPRPEDFCIHDIAHALSHICRFGGHCHTFYSVAQHSCHVSDVLRDKFTHTKGAYIGLMHDATEAYLGDMVRPLKEFMPAYKEAEQDLWLAIARCFNLPGCMPPYVKEADNLLLMTERRDLLIGTSHRWHPSLEAIRPLDYIINPWAPERAKYEFITRYLELQP